MLFDLPVAPVGKILLSFEEWIAEPTLSICCVWTHGSVQECIAYMYRYIRCRVCLSGFKLVKNILLAHHWTEVCVHCARFHWLGGSPTSRACLPIFAIGFFHFFYDKICVCPIVGEQNLVSLKICITSICCVIKNNWLRTLVLVRASQTMVEGCNEFCGYMQPWSVFVFRLWACLALPLYAVLAAITFQFVLLCIWRHC